MSSISTINEPQNFEKQKSFTLNQKFSDQSKNYYQNQIIEYISIDNLEPLENQPRHNFDQDSLEDLAQSIRTYGILQPIIVSTDNKEHITIIAGERRWRAAKIAGLDKVPCIVRELHDHSRLELALIENIQRESLSAVEEAQSYKQLIEEHNYSQETLASRIGKNRATIANTIRLLSLPEKILADLNKRVISAGHARALCSFDNEKMQLKVHSIIVKKKLSVRQTEDLIKSFKSEKNQKTLIDSISPDLRYICDQYKGHLGTKVKITGDTNKGKIEISYYTLDDLERISELILGNIITPPK
ncbi:ParB/RepB/Spo0J family partition protein [Silvanigrella paludirubra]|uniref:ParB/RepB/Spo0J family partition protein n=1 Tax=Silvanigrella paludirubra TaxID=2499159 RepID=A0A6N6VUF5_9BACT|nr:ParB/RepB/Spo0J family partition protein [Silvanigrella paludirubra]KAB8038864.1 ParB/RepB/Spo0J family partition protein [Silvanigrella paludirubra]